MVKCPICDGLSPPGAHRCAHCGADFSDPDVRAMADVTAASNLPESSLGEAGALAGDKFLWMSHEKLIAGTLLRKLALVGGIAMAVGFLLPVFVKKSFVMPWKATDHGSSLALFFPLFAAAAGIALAVVPAVTKLVRAWGLVALGIGGLTLSLPGLGKFAGTSQWSLPILTLGVVIAGVGAALRIYRPRSDESRYILATGALVTVVAMFIPIAKTYEAIPIELWLFPKEPGPWVDLSLFDAYSRGVGGDVLSRFLAMWGLLPLLAFPAAAAIAWPKPTGVWDKSSSVLRPMAWVTVMFIPFGFMLAVFNATGWGESAAVAGAPARFVDGAATLGKAIMIGRAKLAVTSLFYMFWTVFAAVVLFDHFRGSGAHPAATAPDDD